jgi:hypothetical protein
MSPLELGMAIKHNSNVFCKFGKLNWNPFEYMNKTQKSFRKQKSLFFQPILLQNTVFAKIEAKLA